MKTYLALLKKDLVMNDEIQQYLLQQDIEVDSYFKNIGILKLHSERELITDKLKYIEYLELESEMSAMSETDLGISDFSVSDSEE